MFVLEVVDVKWQNVKKANKQSVAQKKNAPFFEQWNGREGGKGNTARHACKHEVPSEIVI